MGDVKRISASILKDIADALRVKRGTEDLIAPADFAQTLRSFNVTSIGTVGTPAEVTGGEERFISEYILRDVADELKRLYGTTDLIPVKEYAPRILALNVSGEDLIEEIPAPTISLADGILEIAGKGAAVYVVYIDSVRYIDLKKTSGTIAVDLNGLGLASGDHTISVVSISEIGIGSAASNTVTYKQEDGLVSTSSIRLLGDILTIKCEDADHYKIYVDGEEAATGNTEEFNLCDLGLAEGEYTITVRFVSASGLVSQGGVVTYTVKELRSPIISINDYLLTITSLFEGAEIFIIYRNGEKFDSIDAENTEYDLTSLGVGTHIVTATAGAMVNGDFRESPFSESVTYTVLPVLPSAPLIGINGKILSIYNFSDYDPSEYQCKIYVDGEEAVTIDAEEFNLSRLGLAVGEYEITARFVSASGFVSDESEAVAYTVKNLTAPAVAINGDVLTITGEGADHYKIYVDGVEKATTDTTTFDLSTLGLADGEYTISVRAVSANGLVSDESNVEIYTVKTLLAPTISIFGNTLSITGEADYYTILVDGKEKATVEAKNNAATYDLSALGLDNGTYPIRVVSALQSGERSEASEIVLYNVYNVSLLAPVIYLRDDGNTLRIISNGGDYFSIYVDGEKIATVPVNHAAHVDYEFDPTDYPVGSFTITATALRNNNGEMIESAHSEAVTYTVKVLSAPRLTIEGDLLAIECDCSSAHYIYLDGVQIASLTADTMTHDLSAYGLAVGTYVITAMSVAEINGVLKSSPISAAVLYTVLEPVCTHENAAKNYETLSNGAHRVSGTCNDCGKTFSFIELCTYGDDGICEHCGHTKSTHNHSLVWDYISNENGTHRPVVACADCGEVVSVYQSDRECTYWANGVCKSCGYSKVPNGCDHTNAERTYSDNGNGTHSYSGVCPDCGAPFMGTELCTYDENGVCEHCGHQQKTCAHSSVAISEQIYISNQDSTHRKVIACTDCGEALYLSAQTDCTYENGVCKYCGYQCAHNYSTKTSVAYAGGGKHGYTVVCNTCGETVIYTEDNCTYDENGICEICGHLRTDNSGAYYNAPAHLEIDSSERKSISIDLNDLVVGDKYVVSFASNGTNTELDQNLDFDLHFPSGLVEVWGKNDGGTPTRIGTITDAYTPFVFTCPNADYVYLTFYAARTDGVENIQTYGNISVDLYASGGGSGA